VSSAANLAVSRLRFLCTINLLFVMVMRNNFHILKLFTNVQEF